VSRRDGGSHHASGDERRSILVVTPWKQRWEMGGGAGLADDYHFIRSVTAAGFDVHYLSPRSGAPPDIALPGYYVHSYPNFFDATAAWPTPIRRLLWPLLFAALAGGSALALSRRVRPCLVLAQTHIPAWVVWVTASLHRVPSVVKLFGVMDLVRTDWPGPTYLAKNLEAILAFKAPVDAWIILDDGTRGDAAARRHGIRDHRLHFLPNGVTLAWQEQAADAGWFRGAARVPEGHDVVLYLARLADWKRPDAFVRAAARALPRLRRPTVFVVAGSGPEQNRCEALARDLGVADRVRFVGPIAHARVVDAFAATTLFVATSRRSNKSIATCEALLCGVPVVAFDVGGTSDVVRDGVTGRLVPDGDVDALADAMLELLNDGALRAAMGGRARDFARSYLVDWEKRTAMEVDIIRRLTHAQAGVADGGPPPRAGDEHGGGNRRQAPRRR
jgi:glycosyltransferase involved in cell wall biosynthesis